MPDSTERPPGPLEAWSIDLPGPIPADLDGYTYAAIAVDPFSKWVEIGALQSKRAFRVADWLHREIVARWGRPLMIRTDNGTEFAAEFHDLVSSLGIKVIKITPSNSRANGQAERMIRTFKSMI